MRVLCACLYEYIVCCVLCVLWLEVFYEEKPRIACCCFFLFPYFAPPTSSHIFPLVSTRDEVVTAKGVIS